MGALGGKENMDGVSLECATLRITLFQDTKTP
jgi:hypothetical protein